MNNFKGKRKMILYLILIFILGIIIFFKIPYSKTKNDFYNDIQKYESKFSLKSDTIENKDIIHLPKPVQRHFRVCKILGKRKMTFMKSYMESISLKESNDKSPLTIDYTLYSFSDEPIRLAYIKSSKLGIPFEGYDSLQNGQGFMKGVLGKKITLFNQVGKEMDKGQLATYLGECFLIPSSILSKYIKWESIDSKHAKSTLAYKGVKVSGVFTFDEKGFVKSFVTDERANIKNDGRIEYVKWSGIYGDYTQKNGFYSPTTMKAVWHYDNGDLIYFDAKNIAIEYDKK